MRLLIKIRLKSMFGGMKKSMKSKKAGAGALLILAVLICIASVEVVLFGACNLLAPFLETSFAWLYFALIGILAFAIGILGTVFTTQSQMYEAKDNEMLLAMPIKPFHIIFSRVLALYILTLGFTACIMLPAGLVYGLKVGFSVKFVVIYLVSMFLLSMIIQTITCLLGWLLHFVLAGFKHKALVATFFMTVVMVAYIFGINQLEGLLMMLIQNGGKIAEAIQSFVWPFYALGQACMGDMVQFLLFTLFSVGVFAGVMFLLSKTFVKAMLAGGKTKSAGKQKRDRKIRTPEATICRKESKRFFTSTTYLVNVGMGIFMMVALVIAGVVFKSKITVMAALIGDVKSFYPFVIVAVMGFIASMTTISAPSVSLEGKHIWILRSMPISGAEVLRAKLRFHCMVTATLAFVGGLILGIVYECSLAEILMAAIGSALMHVLCGVLGLVLNMCFPRLDWPTEAAPCKQSMAVFLSIIIMMFLCIGVFALSIFGINFFGKEFSVFVLLGVTLIIALVTYLLYLLMVKWGGKKFETL